MKLDLLPYHKGLGITEGSLITVWAITVNGYAIKVFEGLTNGGEQSIQSNETGYAYDSSIGYSNPNWVGKINGERTISEVSFAGTHGSIALHGVTPFDEDWVRNQRMTITTQLNSGIRYFDIRARRTQNSFAMHHGSVFQKLMFGDVLDAMALFLRQNPYETILMRLKEEHDPETGSASFETILTRYWNLYNSYFWDPKSSNPKLKDVRGKIIIIQNFSASKSFGISYNSLVIQDHDNVDDAPDAMYDKWNRVKSHLQSANNSNKTQIYLNHLSGNGGYNGAKPWFVSSGYNSRGTDSIKKLIQESNSSKWPDYPRGYYGQVFYGGTNLLTKEFIPRLGLQHVGIIAADFPGKGLIDTVVKLNGRLSTSDIQYVRLNANKEIEVGFTGDVYVRKHYQIKRNGSYIASLENGTAYYSYWQQTSFGHQLTRKGITLFTGDKIQVYLVDGGKETLLATLTVEIKEEELEIIQVPDGPYKIISELNKSSVVDLSKTSSQNVALWTYNNQLEGEWDFKYDSTQKAYRIYNRWNSSLVMARNAYDEGINVFGTPYEGKLEHLWIIRRTGDNDGTVYLQNKKDETKQLMLDVQAGGTSNGTNINIWPLNRLKQQKFKLVARRETLESQIDSSYRPLSGQKNRSSSNFSLGHLADGTRVRVSIEGAGSVNLSFRVMRDKPADTDPTIWSDVKNGSILTVQSGANKKDLYIANPSGYSSNGTFKVKFYTLEN
ncbi:hypothetical protein BTW32_29450 [Bacillus thuringiensis]|nr:hypothetical protein BTW32_29450 [Bacillus thuringiensis]